jgi:hypothetical protein
MCMQASKCQVPSKNEELMASNKIFTKQLHAPLVDMPKLLEYLHWRGRCIKLVAHNPHLQLIL